MNLENEIKIELGNSEIRDASPEKLHNAVSTAVMKSIAEKWDKSKKEHLEKRRACYFSMEFLMGRAIYNNLLCLGLTDEVEKILNKNGASLSEFEQIEDAALGNGGLGRLAACFLDSAATLNLPLDGYGIRYKYGIFRQTIENGFQREYPDDWTRFGDPWSVRCDDDAVIIEYSDRKVKAVPYDMPIFGYKTDNIGTLRLWQAESLVPFDFDLFNEQKFLEASKESIYAEDISRVLYPNDDTDEGKKLRLRQQYFFCAASIADIIKKYVKIHGSTENIEDYISIQLNDTHPVVSIPELCRVLCENYGWDFEKAYAACRKIFNYTNHTIMQEALEKWNSGLFESLLPNVYKYIVMISEKFIAELYEKGVDKEQINRMRVIQNNTVHMAYLASCTAGKINGVAKIHSELLKTNVLADWYKVYPEKFCNETNGITQRRWLALCNPELSKIISEILGNEDWIKNASLLKGLEKSADDKEILEKFIDIKQKKKVQLAEFIKSHDNVEISPNSVFDVQIKRLHEYKRQLLNAFSIMWLYFGIKEGSIKDLTPVTFIFGAKSAPGYRRAKAIIKYINEIADLVNNDGDVNKYIKVVFVQNYNVSYAEKLVAASDISEQISTAGTEASGTGNMKLSLNGSVTLGTWDGANIEIVEEAGDENNYIFGARVEELEKIMQNYDPRKLFSENEKIRRVVNTLIDGRFSDGGSGDFRELYYSLLDGASWHVPDNYYVLGDLESYVNAKLRALNDYKDRVSFAKKQWMNIANSGKFSSDRTIADYAENIWKIK